MQTLKAMAHIEKQRVIVRLGGLPEEGMLLLCNGELLALLVWLAPDLYGSNPDIAGKWSVELGFGACSVRNETILFETLAEAEAWAVQCGCVGDVAF